MKSTPYGQQNFSKGPGTGFDPIIRNRRRVGANVFPTCNNVFTYKRVTSSFIGRKNTENKSILFKQDLKSVIALTCRKKDVPIKL